MTWLDLLQALAEASSKRLVNLASQWEKHRIPLIEQHRTLKDSAAGAMVELCLHDIYVMHIRRHHFGGHF